jgi:hypothetical protein
MRAIAKVVKVSTPGRCAICGERAKVYLTRFEQGTQMAICAQDLVEQIDRRADDRADDQAEEPESIPTNGEPSRLTA